MGKGFEPSRRDDLEAIGYVLLHLNQGHLPWQRVSGIGKEKYDKIGNIKMSTSVEVLCKDAPIEFATYFNYVRNLGFEDTPDYASLRRLLKAPAWRNGYQFDFVFDWTM